MKYATLKPIASSFLVILSTTRNDKINIKKTLPSFKNFKLLHETKNAHLC